MDKSDTDTANRILLAAAVLFITSITTLMFAEYVGLDLSIGFRIFFGLAFGAAFITDRLYIKYFMDKEK